MHQAIRLQHISSRRNRSRGSRRGPAPSATPPAAPKPCPAAARTDSADRLAAASHSRRGTPARPRRALAAACCQRGTGTLDAAGLRELRPAVPLVRLGHSARRRHACGLSNLSQTISDSTSSPWNLGRKKEARLQLACDLWALAKRLKPGAACCGQQLNVKPFKEKLAERDTPAPAIHLQAAQPRHQAAQPVQSLDPQRADMCRWAEVQFGHGGQGRAGVQRPVGEDVTLATGV